MADQPNRLFELRRARGWSQQELADRIGVSKMQVSGLERGKREFSLTMMRRFAEVFQVTPGELLSREDNAGHLSDDEWRLIDTYRSAEPSKRDDIHRVAEALTPFRGMPRDAA